MSSYKVYLTKSSEVAHLIQDSYRDKFEKDGIEETSCGPAKHNDYIPSIYQDCGYFCCTVKSKSENPKYELIFA